MNLRLQPDVANNARLFFQNIVPEGLLPGKMPCLTVFIKRIVFIALQPLNLGTLNLGTVIYILAQFPRCPGGCLAGNDRSV